MQTKPDYMDLAHKTVGALVADDYRKAEIFKRFDIDFCCGGGKTVKEVCEEKGLNYNDLERALLQVQHEANGAEQPDVNEWTPGTLIDHIIGTHHAYVRANLPLLKEFTAKVARVHGHANPEVVQIASLFDEVAAELGQHMMKEEHILFPFIKHMAIAQDRDEPAERPPFGTVQNPIRMMEAEHDRAGNIMKEIRTLSRDFAPPEHACTTYRVAYFKLEEFETDLHRHIHLENNVLFPMAIALEQRLSSS
ncbi:MAG: iron-sulfur cluster repair di-iron protein [Rhodothermales bacterium]